MVESDVVIKSERWVDWLLDHTIGRLLGKWNGENCCSVGVDRSRVSFCGGMDCAWDALNGAHGKSER